MLLGASTEEDGRRTGVLNGTLHAVRFSNSAGYAANFNAPDELTSDGATLALFRCDEGAGATLHDASGNGHDGSIVGATWIQLAA